MLRRVACGWLVASLCGGWLAQADGVAGSLIVRLGTTDRLPESARQVMLAEAERLWTSAGLRLVWQLSSPEPETTAASSQPAVAAPLRVIVVERAPAASSDAAGSWTVGQLLPFDTGASVDDRALAIVSIAAARRVVEAGRRAGEPDARATHRLGMVLGRTLAHEIGHYVLGTRTHARRGLMRGRIAPDEFADLRYGGFTLDGDARDWLRQRWSRLGPAFPPAARTGFSYPAR